MHRQWLTQPFARLRARFNRLKKNPRQCTPPIPQADTPGVLLQVPDLSINGPPPRLDFLSSSNASTENSIGDSLNVDNSSITEPELTSHGTSYAGSRRASTGASTVAPVSEYLRGLRDDLGEARIEWPPNLCSYFCPIDQQKRLITPDSVLNELRRCNIQFKDETVAVQTANNIAKQSPKLFAVLVCVQQTHRICQFLHEKIDDTHMPFERLDTEGKTGKFLLCSKINKGQPIQCMKDWDFFDISQFGREQWSVLAPVFEFGAETKHFDFDDNTVFPYVEDNELGHRAAEGGFGWVWRVKIHPAHQVAKEGCGLENSYPYIAVKQLHSSDEKSFNREVETLKRFNKQEHPNLVRLLATYRFKGKYFLLFPYANSNLREYWTETPLIEFTDANVKWVLQQKKAIASGLFSIHEHRRHTQSAVFNENQPSQKEEDCPFGRHGDIKPENILWFVNDTIQESDKRGQLVIADFGLTDFHRHATRSNVPAGHISGSPTYEPPELMLHQYISREYDIWSLGCVYLEFLTWLLCGSKGLELFPDARGEAQRIDDDTFFTVLEESHTAIVRESVREWMADLHEMPRCSRFIHEMLSIISEDMLVVDPKERIKIGPLTKKLDDMLKKVEKDPYYLTQPRPSNQRTQQPQPNSLAASGLMTRGPRPRDGTGLPRRYSTSIGLNSMILFSPQVCPNV